jgi:quinoprotein glucose dehydrogenase
MAWVQQMADNKPETPKSETWVQAGQRLYMQNCMTCHGADRKGTGNNPTLIDVNKKYNHEQFIALVSSGRRMMPAFSSLKPQDKEAIASFILDIKADQKKPYHHELTEDEKLRQIPYSISGYNKFLEVGGRVAPPWEH